MIDSVPGPTRRVLEGGSLLHRYHGSLEQDYGQITKSNGDFTIRNYVSAATVISDGDDEEPRIREEDTIFIQLSASLGETVFSGNKEEFLTRDAYK